MQIIYISKRPDILLDTLALVARHMPFVKHALVCTPVSHADALNRSKLPLPVEFAFEEEILSKSELKTLVDLDHQSRNYLLRAKLATDKRVETSFIMSDDDYRPLRHISINTYVEKGKYHRYYFHDLMQWQHSRTEFDAGQISTGSILSHRGLPYLSYASHMPQVVDRDFFLESINYFEPYCDKFPLCEWSTYFNYSASKYPDKFHAPRPFLTLCWPEHPLAWTPAVTPDEYLFENYTPALYRKAKVFDGLNADVDDRTVDIEKVIRWRKYSIHLLHPEQLRTPAKYLKWRTWINKLYGNRR